MTVVGAINLLHFQPLADGRHLTQLVIYDHPRDHPDWFVVRAWDIDLSAGARAPRKAAGLFKQLEDARAFCAQFGLLQVGSMPEDDPCIVEVWT